jgi:glutamine synthetase
MCKIIAEYIWIGGEGELRSKARTLNLDSNGNYPDPIPEWNYDGSSTKQADGKDSEVIIKPCTIYKCPFRNGNNILVMCDTYKPDGTPLVGNNRNWAKMIFDSSLDEKPWYGIEQEFFMISNVTKRPLGFPSLSGFTKVLEPNPQGQYYCSVGAQNAFGREVVDTHYEYCLHAGLSISGINAEVAPGQWEYQIGPVEGINAGDQLYISRYILQRIAEKYNISIDFEPKPIKGDWNGSGCHTNYSTKSMREGTRDINGKTGLDHINDAIQKLELKHDEHMKLYGSGNELRMTGEHETSRFDKFTYGVANRGASIRIPNTVVKDKCGYFEDRRPSSNMDPYLVTGIIFNTCKVKGWGGEAPF